VPRRPERARVAQPTGRGAAAGMPGMNRFTVGLIEDDPFAAELACLWLEQAGYHAEVYPSATAFFARPALTRLDAIVLDWNLPDTSGIDLLDRLRAQSIAPCLVLSGDSDPGLRARALGAGAVEVLLKPVQPEALGLALQTAIRENPGP
jgi:DNA-binding response OmpR family regulator